MLESAASKSQSSNPALPTMCWVLILSGLSSLSLSGPAKPLAEEELLLLAVLSSCTSWKCCKMIFVLSGVNTRPWCCWAVGPGVQLLWPCLWRCCGEAYGAAQGQGLCCCFRGCKAHPRAREAKTHLDIFVCVWMYAVLHPPLDLTKDFASQTTGVCCFILCMTSPPSCQHPWMSVYPLFQRQGFTPLHPAVLTWCKSISVCRAAAAAGDVPSPKESWSMASTRGDGCCWCLCCPHLPQPTWVLPSKSSLAVGGLVPLCALTGAWQRK